MNASDPRDTRLDDLGVRIEAARGARKPKRSVAADKFSSANLAWRMVTELVVGVLLGAAMGWGLDSLLGTMPAFLLIFGMLGFAAGVKTMLRSAREAEAAFRGDTGADQAQTRGNGKG